MFPTTQIITLLATQKIVFSITQKIQIFDHPKTQDAPDPDSPFNKKILNTFRPPKNAKGRSLLERPSY